MVLVSLKPAFLWECTLISPVRLYAKFMGACLWEDVNNFYHIFKRVWSKSRSTKLEEIQRCIIFVKRLANSETVNFCKSHILKNACGYGNLKWVVPRGYFLKPLFRSCIKMLNILPKLNGNFEVKEGESIDSEVIKSMSQNVSIWVLALLSWVTMGQLLKLFSILLFQVSHLRKEWTVIDFSCKIVVGITCRVFATQFIKPLL